jgi:protein-S-isoprenylcysteine O-methyltransferase Ste14
VESGSQDSAGVPVPPPFIYGGALLAGLGLDAVLPSPSIPGEVAWPVGAALGVAGGALAGAFLTAFRRAGTTVDVRSPSSRLVTTGPYRISRNPGYVSLALIHASIATLARAPWAYATLVVAVAVVDRTVIAREERYLERRFGDDYVRYKERTRRWI